MMSKKGIEFKKILWATDFSKASLNSLDYALYFKKHFNSKIIALHVIPELPPTMYDDVFIDKKDLEFNFMRIRNSAEKKLNSLIKRKNIKFDRIIIQEGTTYKIIDEVASKEKVDAIFIGKKSHPLWEKLLIGNTTSRLIHHSNIPLYLVSKKRRNIEFSDILVPVDLEPIMNKEIKYAEVLARKFDSIVDVLHVMELYEYEFPFDILSDIVGKVSKKLDTKLKDVKAKSKYNIVRAISASDAIIEYARKNKSDMIVLATHSRSGISKFLFGSVSEKIVSSSVIPILLIPNNE
jgi:nucleotide-binding universal stress UspA family protein